MNIGDYVQVIDDTIEGEIVDIEQQKVSLMTADNFVMTTTLDKIVKINDNLFHINPVDIEHSKRVKDSPENRVRDKAKINRKKPLEVDLHIENLTHSTRHLSNYQMLQIQMGMVKSKLSLAISQRMDKIVYIHGVGKGVLKSELLDYLDSQDYVSYYDADYATYGVGATEVQIYFSKLEI